MRVGLFSLFNRIGAWVLLLFLVTPALIAIPVSLTPKRFLSMPSGELSLRHFQKLFTSEEWLSSFFQSGVIAVSTSVLIIPQIISAMAFYRLWIPLGLLDSYAGLILAHTILAAPMVLITVSASLATFDPKLEQASKNLGASNWTTMRRVILPSIKPGVFAGALFAFSLSWDEIVVTLFISKFSVYTLPRRMWNGIRENTDPTVAAAAVVLIAITLIAFVVFAIMSRRTAKNTEA